MTPAIRAATAAGVAFDARGYSHDPRAPSYGREAADALGLDPATVFKTLVAELDDGRLVVALVPVDRTLDTRALATLLRARRATMASPAAAERATGYVTGGISPLGQRKRLPTVIDATVRDHARVSVSGGRRGLQLVLRPDDLVALCEATVAPISR